MYEENHKYLNFIPVDEAIVPPHGLINHMKDRWWVYHKQKNSIVFMKTNGKDRYGSAQCNGNEEITKSLRDKLYPWADIIFLPSVFHRIRPEDYC